MALLQTTDCNVFQRHIEPDQLRKGYANTADGKQPRVRVGSTTEVALIRSSRPNGRASFCDGHSGSPACRNPSSYRARSSAGQGPSTALRVETRSAGLSCRSRTIASCACSGRPAIALLAAATLNPG